MASLLVRKLDDDAVGRLKRIAAERGTSLEQFARDTLHALAQHSDTRAERLKGAHAIRARSRPGRITAVQDLRAIRDAFGR